MPPGIAPVQESCAGSYVVVQLADAFCRGASGAILTDGGPGQDPTRESVVSSLRTMGVSRS